MIRKGNRVCFSDEDKAKFCIRAYTNDDIKNNIKIFRKRNMRRNLLFSGLVVLSIAIALASPIFVIKYAADIAAAAVCFLALFFGIIDLLNYRIVKSRYYIEILVRKKLPIETELDCSGTEFSSVTHYYPLEGSDTSTGYTSVCYVEKKEYNHVNIGETIKMNVKGAKL